MRVYLACGVTDMRRGIAGLSALVEAVIKEAPGSGAIFGFRGKRADRIKLLWWDGQGFCLFYKILERGYFPWPTAKDGVAHLTQAQLSMLVEGSIGADRRGLPLLAEWDKVLILQGIPDNCRRFVRKSATFCGMETTPLHTQDELSALRALVAEQAAKLSAQAAEVSKRDSIIGLLRAQRICTNWLRAARSARPSRLAVDLA